MNYMVYRKPRDLLLSVKYVNLNPLSIGPFNKKKNLGVQFNIFFKEELETIRICRGSDGPCYLQKIERDISSIASKRPRLPVEDLKSFIDLFTSTNLKFKPHFP